MSSILNSQVQGPAFSGVVGVGLEVMIAPLLISIDVRFDFLAERILSDLATPKPDAILLIGIGVLTGGRSMRAWPHSNGRAADSKGPDLIFLPIEAIKVLGRPSVIVHGVQLKCYSE